MRNFESRELVKFLTTTSQGKSYAVTAATVIMLILMFLVGVFPAVSAIFAQITENEKRVVYLAQLETGTAALRSLVTQLAERSKEMATLESFLPTEVPQSEVYNELSTLGSATRVQITFLGIADLDSNRTLDVTLQVDPKIVGKSVRFSATGSREDLLSLIASVEEMGRIYALTGITLVRLDGEGDEYQLDATAEIYFWNLPSNE